MMARLEEVCSLITDGSHFSPEDEGVGYPMFSVKDMTPNGFNISGCKKIGEEAYKKLVANGCKPLNDDVVVAKDGSYLKTAFVIKGNPEIALLSSIAILRPKIDLVVPEYLSYFLKSDAVYRIVSLNYITGTALKRIILKGIRKIEVDLPDIGEQEQRAQRLSKVDYLCQLRKQQLAKLDELVKARFVEMFLLHDYPTKTLDELSIGKGEYGAQSASTEYDSTRPRYVRITDVNEDGTLNDDKVSSENITDDEQYRLSYGDFMFARMGATVGKTYAFLSGNQIFAGYLIRYKLNLSLANPRYLFWYTKLDDYQKWVKLNQSGAAQPGINAKKYGSLKIPVPPIALQNQFAAFVERVDQQKQIVQQSLEKLELMKKALMQEYFG